MLDLDNIVANSAKLFCPDSLTTRDVPGSIAWPILWFVTSHSAKHRFAFNRPPDSWSTTDVQQFINKLKWRLHLTGSVQDNKMPLKLQRPTPFCPNQVNPDFQPWANAFRASIARSVHKLSKSFKTPTFGLQKLALRLLKRLPFLCIQNDKDNGITFVHTNDMEKFWLLTVPTPLYRPITLSSLSLPSLSSRVSSLTYRIAAFEKNPKWKAAINHFLGKPFVANMGAKLKTHKAQYAILPRSIHLAGTGSLAGLSSWLVQKVLPTVRGYTHIVKDSHAMREAICNLNPLPPGVVMGTYDVKDYYLTGTDTSLAAAVGKSTDDLALRSLLYDVTFTLLEAQIVKLPCIQQLYVCSAGSGIGLKHSSVISACGLLHQCELSLLDKHANSLVGYFRFEDDLIVFTKSMQAMRDFGKDLCHGSPPYKVIARQISRSYVNILDLHVHFSHNHLQVNPSFDKIPSPLCPTSAHAPHVHSSWPAGLASRALSLSDNREEALRRLISQYSAIHCDPRIVDRFSKRDCPISTQHNRSLARSQETLVTCVLKYHPLLRHAVTAALKEVALPESLGFSIRIAWKNALPSVSSLIARHNFRQTHPGQEGGNSVCEHRMQRNTLAIRSSNMQRNTLAIMSSSSNKAHPTSLLALASN